MWMSWARGESEVISRLKHHLTLWRCQAETPRGNFFDRGRASPPFPLPRPFHRRAQPRRVRGRRRHPAHRPGSSRRPPRCGGAATPPRLGGGDGHALVPRGAGSGMAGGSVGRGVIVDLSHGFRWTAPDWPRRTIWVGAAVTWADVNGAARPFGLRLPPDPSSGAFATSGGMVATNAAGPRSVRCGSVRSWVEAIEIIGTDGEARRVTRGAGSGERFHLSSDQGRLVEARFPKTRKNSAGYALNHFADSGDELDLLIGSEGTLAFVTAVAWRLEPIPPDVAGVALGFRTLAQLTEAVPFLVALTPSAVELLDRTLLDFVR